jgi:hypothetical protein
MPIHHYRTRCPHREAGTKRRTSHELDHVVAYDTGGCSSAASRVSIEAAPPRPDGQVRVDSARCADAATSVRTDVNSVRDREYASCLLAQGYRIAMPFRAGVDYARLVLGSPAGRPVAVVGADLAACEDAESAGRVGRAEIVAGQIGGVQAADSARARPHTGDSGELANRLASCLRQRGYDAARWAAGP